MQKKRKLANAYDGVALQYIGTFGLYVLQVLMMKLLWHYQLTRMILNSKIAHLYWMQ